MSESGDAIRVLHVDDDPDLGELVATALEGEDERIDVETAADPDTALAVLGERAVDCVVSDYDMPGTDGIEFLEAVRGEHPELPFILYTGKGSEAIASEAISAGVTDYLQKETGTSQYAVLAHRIGNAVEQYRSRQEVAETERKLSQLAEKTDEILFMFDSTWTELLFINDAYEEVWNQSIGELEENPRSFLDNVHPEDEELVERTLGDIMAGQETAVEHRIRTDEGEVRWIYSEAKPVYEDGSFTRIVGFVRDITERKRTERELREERQFVQSMFRSLPDPLYAFDLEGYPLRWNDEFEAVCGYAPEAIEGMHVTEFVPDEESETIAKHVQPILEERRAITVETAVETADGERIPFELTGGPLEDAEGYLRGMTGVGRDVTAHRARQRELERTRDFFTEAERLGDLGAWEFDEGGEVVWTDGTKRIHEVGEDYEPTLEEAIEFFHPEDREAVERAVERALDRGESYELEARLITAEGETRWVRARGKVLQNGDGELVRGYIQDITEEKRRERELERMNAQLENAIEAGAVGTWEWHVSENRLVVGKEFARRFGVDPAAARSGVELERFTSSIHPADRERVEGAIEDALAACGEYECEYRVRDAAGEDSWVLARGHVECEDGEPVGFPGVLVDITERKQVEGELKRQNERLNEFASVVSHDLRSPLNVLDGRLELLAEECESEHIDTMARTIERMDRIIEDVLVLAREGQDVSETEPVRLAEAVDAAWTLAAEETEGATLEYAEGAGGARIEADPDRLQRLLENLVRNAIQHAGQAVTVTVGGTDRGFYVEDDGPGIPAGDREEVFDAGYSTGEGGTGFGLGIVDRIAEAHGWSVQVTEGTAGGARFEITDVESP